MPLKSACVRLALPAIECDVTTRMILAYSANIGETNDCFYDDRRADFRASPFFCVSPEWQFVLSARRTDLGLSPDEALRAVHARQSTRFLAPLLPGRRNRVSGTVVAVRAPRAGAVSTTRMKTVDLATGAMLTLTESDAVYRGVAVEGPDCTMRAENSPESGQTVLANETPLALDRWFAHRYSECASIWNPIHTEESLAHKAGLPGCIVHGTALWALAGRTLVAVYANGDSCRLVSFEGRFSAMAEASTLIAQRYVRIAAPNGPVVFVVRNVHGKGAISDGVAVFRQH